MQRVVAFGNRRRDEIVFADAGDADAVAGMLFRPGEQQGVVVGERVAAAIKQGVEGFGVLVVFQAFDVAVFFAEVAVGGGAFVQKQGFVFQFVDAFDGCLVRRDDAERDFHVRLGVIHHFGALRGNGEVGKDDVHFVGAQVFDAVRRFYQYEFGLGFVAEQLFGEVAADFDVKALRDAVGIHIAKGRLVAEDADAHFAFGFEFVRGGGEGGDGACREQGGEDGGFFHVYSW